jgi:hypothetical protein
MVLFYASLQLIKLPIIEIHPMMFHALDTNIPEGIVVFSFLRAQQKGKRKTNSVLSAPPW